MADGGGLGMGGNQTGSFNKREKCMVCGVEKRQGLHIVDQFICEACENDIVHTDVGDPKYADYLSKLSILNIKGYRTVESGR